MTVPSACLGPGDVYLDASEYVMEVSAEPCVSETFVLGTPIFRLQTDSARSPKVHNGGYRCGVS